MRSVTCVLSAVTVPTGVIVKSLAAWVLTAADSDLLSAANVGEIASVDIISKDKSPLPMRRKRVFCIKALLEKQYRLKYSNSHGFKNRFLS